MFFKLYVPESYIYKTARALTLMEQADLNISGYNPGYTMGSVFYSKRYKWENSRNRKRRPKTFKTEEIAKQYVEERGLQDYKIEKLQESKFRVVA